MVRKQRPEVPQLPETPFTELAERYGGVTRAMSTLGFDPHESRSGAEPHGVASTQVRVAVVASALARPNWGAVRAAKELQSRGIEVTPGRVRQTLAQYALDRLEDRREAGQRAQHLSEPTRLEVTTWPQSFGASFAAAFSFGALSAAILLYFLR